MSYKTINLRYIKSGATEILDVKKPDFLAIQYDDNLFDTYCLDEFSISNDQIN